MGNKKGYKAVIIAIFEPILYPAKSKICARLLIFVNTDHKRPKTL